MQRRLKRYWSCVKNRILQEVRCEVTEKHGTMEYISNDELMLWLYSYLICMVDYPSDMAELRVNLSAMEL